MDVAMGRLAPGVGDADYRLAGERLLCETLGLEPGAVEEPFQVARTEPLVAPPDQVLAVPVVPVGAHAVPCPPVKFACKW